MLAIGILGKYAVYEKMYCISKSVFYRSIVGIINAFEFAYVSMICTDIVNSLVLVAVT